jgi:hypothetical protein
MSNFRRLSCGIALAVLCGGGAHAAVCTVTDARVLVRNFDLEGVLPISGFAIPVEIAESSGNFRMDFSDFPNTHFTIVGVDSEFDLPPQGFDGSLDASGNVTDSRRAARLPDERDRSADRSRHRRRARRRDDVVSVSGARLRRRRAPCSTSRPGRCDSRATASYLDAPLAGHAGHDRPVAHVHARPDPVADEPPAGSVAQQGLGQGEVRQAGQGRQPRRGIASRSRRRSSPTRRST